MVHAIDIATDSPYSAVHLRRFFSLKWQALLLLSLVLIAINGMFYWLQSQHLRDEFAHARMSARDLHLKLFQGLVEDTAEQLLTVSELVPLLSGMKDALRKPLEPNNMAAFEASWPFLQIVEGIDLVIFFDGHGNILSSWGDTSVLAKADHLQQISRDVVLSEQPSLSIECNDTCKQLVFVPVLGDDAVSGAILLASSLAQPIVQFSDLTNTNIGVALPVPTAATELQPDRVPGRHLTNWGLRVVALTRFDALFPVVKMASEQHRERPNTAVPMHIQSADRTFEITLSELNSGATASGGYFFIVDDISEQVLQIQDAEKSVFTVGVAGLVLSELALLAVLWAPLSRLRRIASALPLLAIQRFSEVKKAIKNEDPSRTIVNEIHLLEYSALLLAVQLERLNGEVQENTQSLNEKVADLAKERDFVKGLLETAQVIVLTQDRTGTVKLVNPYTQTLTGYGGDTLIGRSFSFFSVDSARERDSAMQIRDVARGILHHYQHESILVCRDGSTRCITWLHSHLHPQDEGDPVILSVGLDVTARKQAEKHVTWLADHDPLTGLVNRRRFQMDFDRVIRLANRYQRRGALLFIDMDHFKYVNDSMGHQMGDLLLKTVAEEIHGLMRDTDIVARFGGDEFAVLMPEIDRDAAVAVATKINARLKSLSIPSLDPSFRISTSIGVALFPDHGATVDELLANADLAMYHVKENRRGDLYVFSEGERARERLQLYFYWKNRIDHAFAADRFILHYQPIINVKSGTIVHYEALLRMLDDDGSALPPQTFIAVAEKSGLIRSIDHFVLSKAITSLASIFGIGSDVKLAINLSAFAFTDPEFLPLLKHLISTTDVRTEQLIFEITETAALADFSAACTLIDTIRKMGCRFALDDFGSGFSSFYYLRQLPVDYVKIDGAFIRNLATNHDDQLLVKAISDIAKGFGKETIAEFVESEETLEMLRTYDVNFAQGYHIGRPRKMAAGGRGQEIAASRYAR